MRVTLYQLRKRNPSQECGGIILNTFIQNKRVKIGLGISVPFKGWDKRKQVCKKNAEHLQPKLDAAVDRIKDVYKQMEKEGVLITPQTFKNRLELKEVEEVKVKSEAVAADNVMTFTRWVDQFIKDCEEGNERQADGSKISLRTIQKYRTVQEQLNRFSVEVWGRQLDWSDFDDTFLNRYKAFRADQGLSTNTISKDKSVLKFWIKTANIRDIHTNKKWRAKSWQKEEIKTKKPALTEEELKALRIANMSRESLNICRDLFLVSCWTGARISDLKRLPEIIKNAWDQNSGSCPIHISFVQEKTKTAVRIPVLPELRAIIEKWNGELPRVPAEQKMNKRIKEVCKEAGFERMVEIANTKANDNTRLNKQPLYELISNHTGRRTFATLIYKKGILSNGQLMSLTGHSSETAFLRYLDITTEEISAKAGAELLKAFAA